MVKGPSDGESGVVKTFASRAIASDCVCVDNALELFNFLSRSVLHEVDGEGRRHFYYVDKEKIEADREKLVRVKTVPGTHKIHQITPGVSTNSVSFRRLTCKCSDTSEMHHNNEWSMRTLKGNPLSFLVTKYCFYIFSYPATW